MEKNQIQKIQIKEWTANLKGKGYKDISSFEFPYVGPGDEVSFEKRGRGKRTWYKVHEIKASQDKQTVEPKCNYFGACGGCRAQQIPYSTQFQLKTKGLVDYYLENWGIIPELVPASEIWSYRNRMDFAVFPEQIGLRQEGNFRKIIDIENCEIQSPRANLELRALKEIIAPSNLAYNRQEEKGFLKYITLRTNSDHSELQTILTFTDKFQSHPEKEEWKQKFLEKTGAEHLIFCYNREKAEVSAVGTPEVLKGKLHFTEQVLDREFHVPFDSFFQPNPKGFLPILKFMQKEIESCKEDRLVDLFCGTGFFTLLFGEGFQTLSGYDIVPTAIEKANILIRERFPDKDISFQVKDLYSLAEEFLTKINHFKNSLLILDPPRNGMGKELIKIITNSDINKIIYVSCNPYSQKDDIENLKEFYTPISILFTDPYPHTPHLESVLVLEKKNES